jgi:hypothetical protein
MAITKEALLAEVEDLLRTMPDRDDFEKRSEESGVWIGRAAAVVKRWNNAGSIFVDSAVDDAIRALDMVANVKGRTKLKALLQEARADLRLDLGALSVVVQQGQVFDYFDELRKLIEPARGEVFFVDPYLDAEFVSRYLPHVAAGTVVRLLGGPKRLPTLLPAVMVFRQQSNLAIQVRSSLAIHDRYLFIDGSLGYVSGASFKDGAKKAPVGITQIIDAFKATWNTYCDLWDNSKIEI